MSDKPPESTLRREARHASIYALSAVLTQLGGFILIPLYWKKLSPADYGIIGITEILCAFLAIFWGLSLDISISRFYYEWPEADRKRRLGTLWVASWGSSVVLGALSIILVWIANPILNPEVAFYPFVFFGLTHGIMVRMRQITFATIRIKQMPWVYFFYSTATFLLTMGTNLVFVLMYDWGLWGYFLAWNVSELILLAACTVLMLRFSTPNLGHEGLREAMHFALPMIPNNMISSLPSITDRYLLKWFVSLEALGIYTVCLKFVNIVLLFHEAIKMSFVPFIFKAVSEEGRGATAKIARMRMYYMIPVFCAGFAIALFIRDFVHLVGRPDYYAAAEYVPLLVGPSVLLTFFAFFACGIMLAKRTDKLWIPTTAQLPVVVLCGVLLIPAFQLYGLVAGRYITVIAFVAVGAILSQRYYPIPFNAGKVIMLIALLGGAILVAHSWRPDSLILSMGGHAVLLAAFSAAAVVVVDGPFTIRKRLARLTRPSQGGAPS